MVISPASDPNPMPLWRQRLALAALPILIWALAWYFHLGVTGPWADDWFFQFTSPETGEAYRYILPTWSTTHHRPLHHIVMPLLETALADARWLAVLITAAGHGLAALCLCALLRSLGFTRMPAYTAAMLWMVYPVLFDIPLWVAAVSTGYAIAISLVVLRLAVFIARGGSLWYSLVLGVLAYTTCALNEQPATMFVALPLIAIMTGATWKRRLLTAALPTLACGLGVLMYLLLMMHGVPGISQGLQADERGSTAKLIGSLGELHDKWNSTKDQANREMWMTDGFLRGAVEAGIGAIKSGPMHKGWGWSALLLGAIVAACVPRIVRLRQELNDAKAMPWQKATWLGVMGGLVGAAIFFAGFVPVLLMRDQPFYTRLASVPAIGLAVLFAVFIEVVLRNAMLAPRLGKAVRIAVAVVCSCVIGLWTIGSLGMQEGMHRRVLQDRSEASQFRKLLPNPPEGACVIFVSYSHLVTNTGHAGFDKQFPGAANVVWSTSNFVKRAYSRWDVWGVGVWHQHAPPVQRTDERGLWLDPKFVFATAMSQTKPPLPEPFYVPWDRAVLVRVDEAGVVLMVSREDLLDLMRQ